MDREKIRTLLDSMDEGQRKMLAEELQGSAKPAFSLEDITVDRLRDREFSAALRAEVAEALKGLR